MTSVDTPGLVGLVFTCVDAAGNAAALSTPNTGLSLGANILPLFPKRLELVPPPPLVPVDSLLVECRGFFCARCLCIVPPVIKTNLMSEAAVTSGLPVQVTLSATVPISPLSCSVLQTSGAAVNVTAAPASVGGGNLSIVCTVAPVAPGDFSIVVPAEWIPTGPSLGVATCCRCRCRFCCSS